jgi:catechol 2,3-dioxygenase-like lactoylglutathione lyase family enzyme
MAELHMIDHTGIGVSDVAMCAAFYDAALGALGMRRTVQMPADKGSDGIGYGVDYPVFRIDRFHPHSTRQHTAFVFDPDGNNIEAVFRG